MQPRGAVATHLLVTATAAWYEEHGDARILRLLAHTCSSQLSSVVRAARHYAANLRRTLRDMHTARTGPRPCGNAASRRVTDRPSKNGLRTRARREAPAVHTTGTSSSCGIRSPPAECLRASTKAVASDTVRSTPGRSRRAPSKTPTAATTSPRAHSIHHA